MKSKKTSEARSPRPPRTTLTVRLSAEEHDFLERICTLKKMSRTAYLAEAATKGAKVELLNYAVEQYGAGRASLSELSKRTGIDVPTIMDAVSENVGNDSNAIDAFMAAIENVAEVHEAPEFYNIAARAIRPTGSHKG